MATLYTDLVSPAELTGFARAAQEDIERTKGTLARWLPNTSVPDVVVRTVVGTDGNGELAQYRAFDAETPIGSGGKAERKVFELLPLGLKERVSEYGQIRARGGDAAGLMLGGVDKATIRVTNAVVDRLEKARGQVLDTGSLTINENGVVQTVNFGRPAGNTVTAPILWDQANAKPLDNLITWTDVYKAGNQGAMPGTILTSRRTLMVMMRDPGFKQLVAAPGTNPELVSVDGVNAALATFGLPSITVYDRKIKGANVLPDNKVYLLPAAVDPNGSNELGATFYGETLEASESDYGIAAADQPGLVVGAWKTRDPIGVWVHSNAIATPILVNPVASMVATVL